MDIAVIAATIGKLVVLCGLSSAAVWDLSKGIIPNSLVLMVAGGGLLFRLATAERFAVLESVAIAGLLFLLLRWLMNLGTFGGGDAKLIGAVTLGQSAGAVLPILANIALMGGIMAVFYGLRSWTRGRTGRGTSALPGGHAEMPYAPAILGGVVLHEFLEIVT